MRLFWWERRRCSHTREPSPLPFQFVYQNWYANYIHDPTSITMFIFVWANADGNCLPTIGGPESEQANEPGVCVMIL